MRKLATAAAVSLALASGSAQALILGEIEMRSALNQPMNAEISLSSIGSDEIDGMLVTLASPEAFARAGIERSQALTDLKFTVGKGAGGEPIILVSSKKPVLEPFLNFLLEVEWARGRMVREYTVLLDPPVFMTSNASTRSTASDTPAVVQVPSNDSLLTPLPIDRSTAAFDESSVVVIDDVGEVADNQAGITSSQGDLGESVDLSGLGDQGEVVELGGFDDLGEVVELGDLLEVDDSMGDSANSMGTSLPAPGSPIDSDIVTLSDTAIANPANPAVAAESSFDPDTGWKVQVMGDSAEVADNVGIEVSSAELIDLGTISDTSDSQTVFLGDGLDAQPTGTSSDLVVQKNDTLWEIAEGNAVSGLSTQQMMLALLEANQQAFINGNINLVKAGAILRIPERNEIASISQSEAIAQVNIQTQLWREYRDNLRGIRATRVASASQNVPATADIAPAANTAEKPADAVVEASTTTTANSVQQATNDLKVVANNQSSATVASTSADETKAPDAELLGSVNQKLQLAREELAATRLESTELAEQDAELKDVTDNMDQLVSVQQDQLAKLQAQLADARNKQQADAKSTDQSSTMTGTDAAATVENTAAAVAATVTQLGETAANTVTQTGDALSDTVAQAGDTASSTTAVATDSTIEVTDNVDSAAVIAEKATPVSAVAPQAAWYDGLMSNRAIAGGFGALAIGALGFTLLRRRKKDDYDDEDLDQVEFVDGEPALDTEMNAAGSAVLGDETHALDGQMAAAEVSGAHAADTDFDADETVSIDEGTGQDTLLDETVSKDDTISEAEVYLAYGLHGQAEDLLKKAIERKPANAEYRFKLLQTFHAQGNAVAYEDCARKYQAQFGSSGDEWENVAEMGQSLDPSNELFTTKDSNVESVGAGNWDGPKMGDDDFASTDGTSEQGVSSQNRDFSSSDDVAIDLTDDESVLMDQSLDPAFAFDESDLEATGDFTQLANELQAEDGLPGKLSGAAIAAAGAAGLAGDDSSDNDGSIEFDASELTSSATSDDMTMDLDQLSEDLNMDKTEILGGSMDSDLESVMDMTQDLEIPDLTSNTDLTADASAAFGSVDEMDTMLDLAKAYIDMGDKDSASSALDEIVKSGSPEQKSEAQNLLRKIS